MLSVIALLTFLGRLFLDWRYESHLLGPAGSFEEAVNVLLFLAFAGGWIWAMLAVGMSSLRTGYGERIGSLGRNMLLLGMFGPVLWFIVMASMALTVTETQVNEGLWVLIFVEPAISLLGLTLFGLTALRSKPMPRLNWLPVLAGIWYPAFYFFLAGYLFTHNGVYPGQYQMAFTIMHLIQFFALCALGTVLANDASEQMATA
jgi:hypothetical protein